MARPRLSIPLLAVLAMSVVLGGQAADRPDLDALYRIKDEGFQRSTVMEIASYLTDVHGPRLTNSPNIKAAAKWTTSRMAEWGLTNVKLEPWGPFGRGWSNEKLYLQATTPQRFPIIGLPKAWSPGTGGLVAGEAVMALIASAKDIEALRGKLQGKAVLTAPALAVPASVAPLSRRYDDSALEQLSRQPAPVPPGGRAGQPPPGGPSAQELNRMRAEFFASEGVLATLEPSRGVNGGTIFVLGPPPIGGRGNPMGARDPKGPQSFPQLVIAAEHYDRIVRTIEKNIPVRLEMDIDNRFYDDDLDAFNIVGEIRGTDLADQIVMLGAHFDSWHGGTGATDNAAGTAVMLEAMRILKATGLKMRRTVRLALWTGEEQGLLGSRAYVRDHFADRQTMALKPEHARLSAYFNVDNGTGAIRGVYLQRNEAVAPVFQAWMEPFRNAGMTTLSIRNTGSTDHVPFDEVGLPAFQFIQDPVEYDTRTHHSNMDVYDRIQPSDMIQNAVIVASFVYNAANRDEKLPRKPLPGPPPR
ncbi:MAG: M20/M25/M40 family metallo-hydrolase [Vicinamibacterales bacterium]|nr:M20/M25/M40 family metallo-hydrolase [Vicinamibacterales bacterium]